MLGEATSVSLPRCALFLLSDRNQLVILFHSMLFCYLTFAKPDRGVPRDIQSLP